MRLDVYNVRGQLVRRHVDDDLAAGAHSYVWDGRMDGGGFAGSGHYLVLFEQAGKVQTRKILMLK